MKPNRTNILLPTDFSDNAWNAVVYALKLYEDYNCTFYFLHSTKQVISKTRISSGKLSETIKKAAMQDLIALKALVELSKTNKNHDFEIILSKNNLKDAIEKNVKKQNIDLVVMGTKGATGAKELLLGSNTVDIIKKMRVCPVLIVPEVYNFTIPVQIAFPTDFNRVYNLIEINALKNIASIYKSKIRIIHIEKEKQLSKNQEDNLENLKILLKEFEHTMHWMPNYTNKAEEIHVFIEELNIDILAMVKYKHSFIESIVNEPVVTKLGYHIKIPFLVIPY